MKSAISQPFSVTASKEPVSVKSIARYYLTEASGTTPSANDSRWKLVNEGEAVPMPTSAAPYLWKKTVTTFTDGTSSTAIEFGGSLGKNGIDYDLVPSHSSIVKAEDGTLSPTNVSCKIIKRNADGTAEQLSSVPTGYSIAVYRDSTTVSSAYTPGSNVSTSGTTTSISFVLKYGSVEVERHSLNVIAEGGQGIDGRGIQSQDYRFKATASSAVPSSPTNDTTWNTWNALSRIEYSASNPYLWRCCKTVYVDGNGNTETTYLVDGPTVWGQDGDDAVYLDLDNQMDSISVNPSGAMTDLQTFTIHATLYKGASPVTGGITAPTASSIALNGVTPTVNTSGGVVTIQYAFTSIPTIFEDRHYTVTIPVVYGGKTYSAVFTLAPVRKGESARTYNVIPSMSACPFARNSDNSLSPASYSVTCGYSSSNGSSVATYANVTGTFNTSWHIFYRKKSNNSYDPWTSYGGAITITSSYQAIEFCIAKTTTASSVVDSNIVDREVVPVLVGGANGANGTNAFVVDLDNEMDAIPCDSSGYLSSARTFNLNIGAYYGTTSVNLNSVSCTVNSTNSGISINTNTAKSPVITFAAGTYSGTYEFTFTCKHNTYGTRTVVFTVVVQKAGSPGSSPAIYNLVPSHTSLSFARDSNGNLTGSYSVTCQVSRTVGGSTSIVTPSTYGLTIKWGWNSTDPCTATYSSALSLNTSSASNTNLVFELYSGSTRIDRETIPIIKDGPKGGTGDPGTGISAVYFARMFTMAFSAPGERASGWIGSTESNYPTEQGLSKENRFLWERKTTSYTNGKSPTYEVSLIAQYESGVCANLLEDTAFNDINDMDAWNTKNGSVISLAYDNNNGFNKSPQVQAVTNVLQQRVYRSGVVQKLAPSTWYTLSFYARAWEYYDIYNGSAVYNSVSPYYAVQTAFGSIYLDPGQEVTAFVTGYVASSAVKMRYYIYRESANGTWAQSSYTEFTSTSASTRTIVFKNNLSSSVQVYFRGYVFLANGSQNSSSASTNRGYVTCVRLYRGCMLDTYLYRGDSGNAIANDTAHPWIVDGKAISAATTLRDGGSLPEMSGTYVGFSADGHVRWQLTGQWKRHSVTFFTSASLAADVDYSVLFRLMGVGHNTIIAEPKLERNTMATEWIEHTNDRMAADFQHIYAGVWSASTAYMYANGVRHVVRAPKSDGTKTFFRLKKRTPASGRVSSTSPYADTSWWEEASFLRFAAAELLLADQAIITFTQTNRILVKNSAGNVSAGMGGAIGDGDVPLWVGASYDDRLSAPFRVNIQGHIFGTKGMIGGWVLADTKMYSQLGRINGTESTDYTNSSFVPNISLDSVNGEILAGKDVRINGDGIQLFNGNTLCAKLSNEFINTAIDTTPQTGNGTLSTYYSSSVYIPTTAYYRATATWQVTKDCGYCYNGSTIKLTNATFKITLPAAPSGGTLSWGTSTLKVYVKGSNGGSYVFYTTTVTTSTINQALTFSNTVTIDGSSLKEGRYTIYYEIVSNFTSQSASGSTPSATLYISAAGWSYSRSVALITLIGNNGIFTRNSNTTYMIQTSGGFLARCGNYALRVTSSGIQKSVNGGTNWTSL